MTADDVEQASKLAGGNVAASPLEEGRSVEDERRHRKQRLAAAFRLFSGSASTRASPATSPPATPSHRPLLGQPVRHDFSHIRVSDLLLVDDDGEVVEGDRPVNEAAFAIHSHVHEARPDVVAAAHAHSLYGKRGRPSAGSRPDHPGRLRLLRRPRAVRRLHRRGARPRGRRAHRTHARRQQGRHPAQPRPAHRRQTVDEAAWWFITMERSCQAQLMAEAAGTPVPIDPARAKQTRDKSVPSSRAGSASSRCSRGSPAKNPTC